MDFYKKFKAVKLNTAQIIALGFAGVIFVGGLLLMLPFASAAGQVTSFTDALFTSATCVCVTGLVTVTTAVHWSVFGKLVILLLIQLGGIGVISMATLIFLITGKRIGLKERRMIQESYNLSGISGMVKIVRKVAICIFAAEGIGAVFYAFCFIPEFGAAEGLAQSVFTSISAFCNAGVDILGENSLAPYVGNPLINLTTMGLIIMAGLGFGVWWDVGKGIHKVIRREIPIRRLWKSFRLHTKMVLVMTGILVIGGALLVFLFEYSNPATIGEEPLGTKILASFFQSVTTRTAGFLTVDQGALRDETSIVSLIFMFIGGSPMGTAGGIKTTTFLVLLLCVKAGLEGKRDVEIFNRRIREAYLRPAVVITVLGLGILLLMTLLLAAVTDVPLLDVVYEITSAVGTVGLTRGITPGLPAVGKWIVIVTMYLGRIGPVTLGTALVMKNLVQPQRQHLAEENIMIG